MQRRKFLHLLVGGAVSLPLTSHAQERKARLGVLVSLSASHPFTSAFRSAMEEMGYIESRNVAIEWRYADAQFSRAIQFALELVQLKVDVIVAYHTPAVRAAMNVTTTIPIVMAPAGAPLELGLVRSLARPGGNVTGLSAMEAELGGKRLDLLSDLIPDLARVGILASKTDPFTSPFLNDLQTAAERLGLRLTPTIVEGPAEFEAAFATIAGAGAQAVIVAPTFLPHTERIISIAAKLRLPISSSYSQTTRAGGLISYSADHASYFRRSAIFVDKILKGVAPRDLPVEQPTKFELAINLRTAKELGLAVPPTLLARADEVIE